MSCSRFKYIYNLRMCIYKNRMSCEFVLIFPVQSGIQIFLSAIIFSYLLKFSNIDFGTRYMRDDRISHNYSSALCYIINTAVSEQTSPSYLQLQWLCSHPTAYIVIACSFVYICVYMLTKTPGHLPGDSS